MHQTPFLKKRASLRPSRCFIWQSVRTNTVVMGGMQPDKVATSKLSRNYCGGYTFNSCALDDMHIHAAHSPCTPDKRAVNNAVHRRARHNIGTSNSKPIAPGVHFKTEANEAVPLRLNGVQGHATPGLCRSTGSHHRERSPYIDAAVVPPSLRRLIPEADPASLDAFPDHRRLVGCCEIGRCAQLFLYD